MYLHLGNDVVVPQADVVAIFNMDNATVSSVTRKFLRTAEKDGALFAVGDDIPKSFIICDNSGKFDIYLSQISSATLQKRFEASQFVVDGEDG